jgi:hypothetical protein
MSTKEHPTDLPVAGGSGPGSDDPSGTLRRALGGSGRRRLVVVPLLVLAVVVGVALSTRSSSSKPTGGVPVTGTVAVQRRDLVETDTESGTISYASPQSAYDRLSGTITWLPRVGQLIKPGQPLYEVDDQPVILMNGTTERTSCSSTATC